MSQIIDLGYDGQEQKQGVIALDFFLEIAKGNVPNHSSVVKFGRISATTGGADDIIWPGGAFTYLTSASTIRIQAGGNAADTAAGTGARAVVISGLDANYNEITDTLTTAGTSASTATTNTYLRVTRAYVTVVGSSEANVGNIIIEAVTGGTTQALIPASEGQTEQIQYTVPAGYTAYILSARISLVDQEGGAATQHVGHFKGWIRLYNESSNNNYESWRDVFDNGLDTDGNTVAQLEQAVPVPIPAKSDLKMTVNTHVANAEADARLYIILVSN